MPFVSDLKLGKKYENISLEYLEYDDIIEQPEKKFKDYDFGIVLNRRKIYLYFQQDLLISLKSYVYQFNGLTTIIFLALILKISYPILQLLHDSAYYPNC